MEDDKAADLLNSLGELLFDDPDYPTEETLLYARVDPSAIAPSIYKLVNDKLLYRHLHFDEICDLLLALWHTQAGNDRWTEIEYVLRDGRFRTILTYEDEIDPEEDTFARRDRIVRKHFGDKPVIYPPPPSDDVPTYEL